mmetsp:Transcript_69870/g.204499  ORF Transcript_69870/g.204499 Transcript_69870/m.204499 type:complete len:133 (-) Transcript_69870:248-646(-)
MSRPSPQIARRHSEADKDVQASLFGHYPRSRVGIQRLTMTFELRSLAASLFAFDSPGLHTWQKLHAAPFLQPLPPGFQKKPQGLQVPALHPFGSSCNAWLPDALPSVVQELKPLEKISAELVSPVMVWTSWF